MPTDCNDVFHHYLPKEDNYKPNDEVRLGSYNIFRLSETRFKRLDITADMMNDLWDVVALSEIQPNRSARLQENVNALIAEKRDIISSSKFTQIYQKPTYLLLLEELQKRDPSWGLVLSPHSQGDDFELLGFFYRANKAKILESNYCKENYQNFNELKDHREFRITDKTKDGGFTTQGQTEANRPTVKPSKYLACTLSLEGMALNNFSKIPLVARFESGKFDFSYITLHLRFRASATELGKCKESCKRAAANMLADLNVPQDVFVDIAGNVEGSKISMSKAKKIARFFEATTSVREALKISEKESDKDVIVAGDYNLEYKESDPLWQNLLSEWKDSKVLIETKTSVSAKEGLKNNYDHFILVNKSGYTDECSVDSAQAIDFLSSDFAYADQLDEYYDPSKIDRLTQDLGNNLASKEVITEKLDQITYGQLGQMEKMPSEYNKLFNVCRIDNPELYSSTCSSPLGVEGQVIRNDDDELLICDQQRWMTEEQAGTDLQKAKLPNMAKQKMDPVSGAMNNFLCQVLYHNGDLPDSLKEQLHPKHATRKNFDGKPTLAGISLLDKYKIHATVLSDHIPIEMTCSTKRGD